MSEWTSILTTFLCLWNGWEQSYNLRLINCLINRLTNFGLNFECALAAVNSIHPLWQLRAILSISSINIHIHHPYIIWTLSIYPSMICIHYPNIICTLSIHPSIHLDHYDEHLCHVVGDHHDTDFNLILMVFNSYPPTV